ncbi:cation efflux protein [Coniochaeta ligniaria NRRL 30616]|uniref:Cation efflux protein n=1 Tax=Coniochaeta ligniaria NRRL 30616 TaxID=1408157 RepID=A0A1J7J4C2_9PEZI|nr:cation efflux protein [Coniochaeta ligniaria NRRL 30616]
MAWSKSTRISVMLAIDIAFFLLELITGFMVHSLALMADAFHMLNDIISLLVGLWAVSVARKATTDKYTYGWLRAEILGAFFNAVFLIALCVSIFLEALTRFIDPPEINNPKLILIVGCLGLASNILGFFVLGGHGHSHGHEEHSHGEDHQHEHNLQAADDLSAAEQGLANSAASRQTDVADEDGRVADLLPEAAVGRWNAAAADAQRHIRFGSNQEGGRLKPTERCASRSSNNSRGRSRRSNSLRHGRLTSIDDLSIHPSSFRQEIIAASRPRPDDDESSSDSGAEESAVVNEEEPAENTPLLKNGKGKASNGHAHHKDRSTSRRSRRDSGLHRDHNHNKPRKPGKGHGHSHGDMGMNAMVLHVIGDMLGNVGVIATALIIWLTDWSGRFYADPAVSLFITIIILRSALPLTSATAKILLQATPDHIDVNDVREDIQQLPGIISCHHVHIWQLSDTKIVASMHIQVAFPISAEGGEKYMGLAKAVRKCLHAYGIHSATIQPEFCLDRAHDHGEDAAMLLDGGDAGPLQRRKDEADLCLLECVDDCLDQGCCAALGSKAGSTHSHGDEHHEHSH